MKNSIILLLLLLIVGCSEVPVAFPVLTVVEQEVAMQKWQRSCALCHVDGNGGAPRVGDKTAWAPRIAQSEAALVQHTLEGLGRMPPLGYCMDCTETEFLFLTAFMAGQEGAP